MDLYQFYPTPELLAHKLWSKFKTTPVRILEPSAGKGDLLGARSKNSFSNRFFNRFFDHSASADVIELDASHHSELSDKGFNLVGFDFLKFKDGSVYSHIIMNPPFSEGVHHVLHAWNILYSGEIAAIVNAETVKNPYSKERKLLLNLIEMHGSVEYINDAFVDAERPTGVEIALIYLRKKPSGSEIEYLSGLSSDDEKRRVEEAASTEHDAVALGAEIAVRSDEVRLLVRDFDMAWSAIQEYSRHEVRMSHLVRRVGKTVTESMERTSDKTSDQAIVNLKELLSKRYENLKERAWNGLLNRSSIRSRLTRPALEKLSSEFDKIKQLEFTEDNIHGFIMGLIQNEFRMHDESALGVFDRFTAYHFGNRVYYCGWKSNDKHRTLGISLKKTRIIYPVSVSYDGRIGWEQRDFLRDVDLLFAIMDGKAIDQIMGLHDAAESALPSVRIRTDYFDFRFYAGKGTIHLYPRRPDLMDRLNRWVGRLRQWLPEDASSAPPSFWAQFEEAEDYQKDLSCPEHKWDLKEDELIQEIALLLEQRGIDVEAMLLPQAPALESDSDSAPGEEPEMEIKIDCSLPTLPEVDPHALLPASEGMPKALPVQPVLF